VETHAVFLTLSRNSQRLAWGCLWPCHRKPYQVAAYKETFIDILRAVGYKCARFSIHVRNNEWFEVGYEIGDSIGPREPDGAEFYLSL
jgi:hypothetical protein